MARTHGRIYTSIWTDDDFRALTKNAQRMYVVLLSQPQINNLGVLPYVPRRWSRFAADDNETAVRAAIAELERDRFVLVDEEAGEVWVRSFVRHDKIAAQPNLLRSAWTQLRELESDPIRVAVQQLYAPIFGARVIDTDPVELARRVRDGSLRVAVKEPLPEDLREGVLEDLSEKPLLEPLPEGVRVGARARSAAPAPTPTPDLSAIGEETTSAPVNQMNGLPENKRRQLIKLAELIGPTLTQETFGVIRSYSRRLPEGTLAKVAESAGTAQMDNPAAYIVAALKDEIHQRQPSPDFDEPDAD